MNKTKSGAPLTMKKSDPYVERQFEIIQEMMGLPHDQLLTALYWIWDVMERSSINLITVGNTAQAVIHNLPLTGDKLVVAVRKNEWDSGYRRIADTFAPPLKDNGDTVEYEYNGVPIILYILEDSEMLQQADTKIYHAEYFKFPNPYNLFLEKYPQFA